MRHSMFHKAAFVVLVASLALSAQNGAPNKDAPNLPPRATPADYQAQAKVGMVTIAAEFAAHSLPTPEGPLTTEDYVVVETCLFGPPGAKLTLSPGDFSLRVNGKKTPIPSQPYGLVLKSLKDPYWVPPEDPEAKGSKTMIGQSAEKDPSVLPHVVHMPIELQRAMEKKAQRASMPEGERPLPTAGLLFFEHRGKVNSVELVYTGPAGKATLPLQP
ncbi:MAG: hypothetical protein ABSG41_01255 [Bryobacteraceae bacterium]